MVKSIEQELAELRRMNTTQLGERYAELYGQPTRTRHKSYLFRKVAWRIQALAEGDLSERALRRAEELANDADVRVMPPRFANNPLEKKIASGGQRVVSVSNLGDPRLPPPGAAITRQYKGQYIRVVVLPDGTGFEYQGEKYKSLTAIAEIVTGMHINGYRFFRLEGK